MIPSAHRRITEAALSKFFSPKALELIKKSNTGTDALPFHLVPALHSTHGNIQGNAKLISKLQQHTEDVFVRAATDGISNEAKDELIAEGSVAWGMLCHAGQDQLAHSNEIDVFKGKNINGKNFSQENPFALQNLEGVKICDFRINKEFRCALGWMFPFLYKRPSFHTEYLKPDRAGEITPHWTMNMDRAGTVHDLVYKHKYGVSGFKVAYKHAIIQTKAKWQETEENLRKVLGIEKAKKLFESLRTWNPSEKFLNESYEQSLPKVQKKIDFYNPEFER
jgi:hypothetical protein